MRRMRSNVDCGGIVDEASLQLVEAIEGRSPILRRFDIIAGGHNVFDLGRGSQLRLRSLPLRLSDHRERGDMLPRAWKAACQVGEPVPEPAVAPIN